MAVTEQRALFNPQVESLAEQYAKSMGQLAQQPFTAADITAMAPSVAPQTALQQQATQLTGQGIGAYSPYVTAAGQAGTAAGAALGDAGTQLTAAQTGLAGIAPYAAQTVQDLAGAQQTLGGVSPYITAAGTGLAGAGTAMTGVSPYITGAAGLTGAGAGTGTGSIASYMSPYQQQVIDTSLAEFDRQAAMRQQAISDAAIGVGGYGGGREGVMQAEYQTQSDRNRAALQAQLQQQGFTQAQAARQADMAAQLGIGGAQQQYAMGLAGLGQAQLGLGGAQQALAAQQGALAQGYLAPGQMMAGVAGQQAGMAGQRAALGQAQLGLGQYELGQAGALQGFQGTDIARAGQVGAMDQAYAQAVRDAEREKARMGLYEPMERMGFLGSGLTGLMGGMGPQYQFATQPNPSPLATALGIGATGAGIYGALQNPSGITRITPFSG
jgi:hypothetical protein